MSPGIWIRCGGSSNLRALEGTPWRVVESQQRISTRQLVDSDREHEILEDLIEQSKPSIEEEGLAFLLFSPFRYPPLEHGSRFGRPSEPSLWYGSEKLETAFAEAAYYRLLFFAGSAADLLPNHVSMSAFQAAVRSEKGVDLTAAPFDQHLPVLTSKTDYSATQQLGSEMRAAAVELFRYPSARDPGQAPNLALFSPSAFALKKPLGPPVTWTCTVTARRDVSWLRNEGGGMERYEFPLATFLVDGALPAPAT